jgi:hypothetical protein
MIKKLPGTKVIKSKCVQVFLRYLEPLYHQQMSHNDIKSYCH